MKTAPKVSVIIPSYNHGRYLRQRLDSIFAQTFQDFEVLFLDDASTDDSRAIAAEYAQAGRIRCYDNERNSGSTFVQWNRGVAEACGEYIWLAESDDYADPGLLAALVDRLDRHPRCGLAYCQSIEVDSDGVVAGPLTYMERLHPTRWHSDFIASGAEEAATYLLHDNTIPNASAVLFRRQLFSDVGGADERMKLAGDWLLWAKMLARADLAYVAQPLNYFRMHSATVRTQRTNTLRGLWERYQVAGFILRHCPVAEETREEVRDHLVNLWDWLSTLDPDARAWHWRLYLAALRMDPHVNRRWAKKLRTVFGKTARRLLHSGSR